MFNRKLSREWASAVCFAACVAFFCAITPASTQVQNPGIQQSGAVTSGHCMEWGPGLGQAQDAGATCGLGVTPAAMTGSNDTNVTVAFGGTPATSLLQSVQIQMGWTGVLAAARLNANVVQSFTNDTNVTASISAQNATLGWAGTLSLARGGLGGSQAAATANQIPVYPGSAGAAVPTFIITAVNTGCTFLPSACISLFGYASPVWYGADPTGVADSTTAIQNAITAVNGGAVVFPAGVFKVSSQISISVISTQIIGAGRLSTVIRTTSATANIFNISVSYVNIAHLTLAGLQTQVQTAGAAVNITGNSGGGKLEDLYISDLNQGIVMSGASGWTMRFIKLLDIYGGAGLLMSGGGGNYFSDNQFDPLFYSTTPYSVTSGYGAWIASHAYTAGNVVIVNGGIFVCQTAGTSNATGSGPVISPFNSLITDGSVQWYFLGSSTSSAISISTTSNSNYIRHSDLSGPWTNGVLINGSDGNILDGLTIGQTIGDGIGLQSGATDTNVVNSIFDGMLYTFGIGVADISSGSANGTRVVNNQFNGAGWYCIVLQGSSNWVIADNTITGCGNITSAAGIGLLTTAAVHANIHDNIVINTAGITSGISVAALAFDYLSIHDNNVQTSSISYAGTGSHNVLRSNLGYNPIGLTAGTSTGTSASTITAGPSPETHYITQSATFNAAVKSGATTLCTVATATVPCVIELGPNESYSVTWLTTQPTYSKFVH